MPIEIDLRLIVMLALSEGPASNQQLKERFGLDDDGLAGWRMALSNLLAEGRISRTGTGRHGDPYIYSVVSDWLMG